MTEPIRTIAKQEDNKENVCGSVNDDEKAERCRPSHPALRRQNGGRLSTRNMNFTIPTNQGAQDHAVEKHGAHSWRYKVLKFVHMHTVQILLMSLLLLDVIILFIEIFLLAQFPPCSTIERDAISCCPVQDDHANPTERFLSEEAGICDAPGSVALEEFPAGCDDHKWHTVHVVEEVLFSLTITILSIFFVELTVTMGKFHALCDLLLPHKRKVLLVA